MGQWGSGAVGVDAPCCPNAPLLAGGLDRSPLFLKPQLVQSGVRLATAAGSHGNATLLLFGMRHCARGGLARASEFERSFVSISTTRIQHIGCRRQVLRAGRTCAVAGGCQGYSRLMWRRCVRGLSAITGRSTIAPLSIAVFCPPALRASVDRVLWPVDGRGSAGKSRLPLMAWVLFSAYRELE